MTRVTEIRYVGYGVPDLDAEAHFYGDVWGLRDTGRHQGMRHFAIEGYDELYVVRLRRSEQRRIDVIALAAASAADVDVLHDRVVGSGCRRECELKIFTAREGGVEHVGADNMAFGRDYIADCFAQTLGGLTA